MSVTGRIRGILSLAVPALVVGALLAAPAASSAATSTRVTFRPAAVPFSAAEIPNSMRGQYSWLGQAAQPSYYRTMDTYFRDQVMWNQLEATAGSYTFDNMDWGLGDAASHGGRFGFRVMAWCPGCWRSATPSWMPLQPGTDIPDWNSPVFLEHWEALMHALGARYGDDPRLGWVDIGGYGKYGEWHVDGEGTPATNASLRRIIMAVRSSFPRQHVVVNAMDTNAVSYAMTVDPTIGLRGDCLGASDALYYLMDTVPAVRTRWKTAPVLTEWCHSPAASTVRGASQVQKYHVSTVSSGNTWKPYAEMSASEQAGWRSAVKHSGYRYRLGSLTVPRSIRTGRAFGLTTQLKNAGSAPTYDAWRVELRLMDTGNHVVATSPLGVDLRTLLSGWRSYSRTATLTAPPGKYRLAVAVVDPAGYLAPMRLATAGRVDDGGYWLGSVTVTR